MYNISKAYVEVYEIEPKHIGSLGPGQEIEFIFSKTLSISPKSGQNPIFRTEIALSETD